MTKNGKCLWIVDTLLQVEELSLRELNDRWERSSLYDGKSLHERTFARYKEHIAAEYNIDISYSPAINKYFIENSEEVKTNALYRYLLSAYRIAGLNTQVLNHKDKLMLEPVPTGTEHLSTLLQAIDEEHTVKFAYRSYYSDGLQKWELIPCFLRIFGGRVHGSLQSQNFRARTNRRFKYRRLTAYSLSEVDARRVLSRLFRHHPRSTQTVFDSAAGRPVAALLFASAAAARIAGRDGNGGRLLDFLYYLRPSFDFYQKVLWMREKVELLGPDEVRQELSSIIQRMAAAYK